MLNSNEVIKHTSGLSILFVEDDKKLQFATMEVLDRFFQTVDTCSNGKDAVEMYVNFNKNNFKNYDIILSDIRMPVMDGIELTEEIRKLYPSQLIIILSAHDEEEYLLKLINLGVQQFVKKPIDYNQLLASFLNAAKKLKVANTVKVETKNIELAEGFTYSLETKSIDNCGEKVSLTKFEIIFIELLLSSLGKIYSNEEIVEHYTSLNETIDASIRKLVSKLRKKIPENSLKSIYATGYKLIPCHP